MFEFNKTTSHFMKCSYFWPGLTLCFQPSSEPAEHSTSSVIIIALQFLAFQDVAKSLPLLWLSRERVVALRSSLCLGLNPPVQSVSMWNDVSVSLQVTHWATHQANRSRLWSWPGQVQAGTVTSRMEENGWWPPPEKSVATAVCRDWSAAVTQWTTFPVPH